ncbi:MAG: DUF3096 domain-containing protein [Alphaproteobacteria bacterium]|nr:DUF3096 domain-containing protein [Alphaproteobacteria bacterium]
MHISKSDIPAILSLLAGVLILLRPRLLQIVVAIYLILTGLIGFGLLKWLRIF